MTDQERLDWIEEYLPEISGSFSEDKINYWVASEFQGRDGLWRRTNATGTSLREAIDKAAENIMREQS